MDQMDTLLLAGRSLLGILAVMALIGLALVLVNFIGRRHGGKPNAPEQSEQGRKKEETGENQEQLNLKDKGE